MDFDLDNSFINSDFDNKLDEPKVTISKQQRNGRKYWTIVEGFQCEELKKFIKKVKNEAFIKNLIYIFCTIISI